MKMGECGHIFDANMSTCPYCTEDFPFKEDFDLFKHLYSERRMHYKDDEGHHICKFEGRDEIKEGIASTLRGLNASEVLNIRVKFGMFFDVGNSSAIKMFSAHRDGHVAWVFHEEKNIGYISSEYKDLGELSCWSVDDVKFENFYSKLIRFFESKWIDGVNECEYKRWFCTIFIGGYRFAIPTDVIETYIHENSMLEACLALFSVKGFYINGEIRDRAYADNFYPTFGLNSFIKNIAKCSLGHYFDSDLDDKCPFCLLENHECFIRPVVGWLIVTSGVCRGSDVKVFSGGNSIRYSDSAKSYVATDYDASGETICKIFFDYKKASFYLLPGVTGGGVSLNGEVVLSASPLSSYDVLSIGESSLIFVQFCCDKFKWNSFD